MSPWRKCVSSGLLVGCAVLTVSARQDRQAPRVPTVRSGIAVYEDADFGGRTRTFSVDVADLRPSGFNDRISSLAIAPGETWELCVDPDYGGRCTTITDHDQNLNDIGWNDRISSMRRVRARGGFGGGRAPAVQTIELFAGTDFSGQRHVVDGPVANLRPTGFNDRALSVRLRGGGSWELCMNADFDDCRVVSDDVRDLASIGLARAISSARPRAFRR